MLNNFKTKGGHLEYVSGEQWRECVALEPQVPVPGPPVHRHHSEHSGVGGGQSVEGDTEERGTVSRGEAGQRVEVCHSLPA